MLIFSQDLNNVFKTTGVDHSEIRYVSPFVLAFRRLKHGFIGCYSFHQPGGFC